MKYISFLKMFVWFTFFLVNINAIGKNINLEKKDSLYYYSFGNQLGYRYGNESIIHLFSPNGLYTIDFNENIHDELYEKGLYEAADSIRESNGIAISADSLGEVMIDNVLHDMNTNDSLYTNIYAVKFKVDSLDVIQFYILSSLSKKDLMKYLPRQQKAFKTVYFDDCKFFIYDNSFKSFTNEFNSSPKLVEASFISTTYTNKCY